MISGLRFNAQDAFDALVFGHSNPDTLNFLRNQTSKFDNTLTEYGRQFINKAKEAVEFFNGSEAINFARSIMSTTKTTESLEYVRYLNDLNSFQNASMTMQRWIMANPNIRQMYFDQRLDGYFDTFVNIHGNDIKDSHYDYRRVTNGLLVVDGDDTFFNQYEDDLLPGDRELTFHEQIDIVHTWSNMDMIIALGKDDPTSSIGGKL